MKKIFLLISLAINGIISAQVLNYIEGSVVPDFTITDIHGQTHSLYNYTAQGKYVVVDFFAYWCGVCAANAPVINDFYNSYGCNSGDVVVLGVELEGTNAQVVTFENTAGLPAGSFPVASGATGGGSAVHSAWGVSAFPTIVAISPANTMLNNDIWPLLDGAAIYSALQDSSVAEMECVAMNVAEEEVEFMRCSFSGGQLILQGEINSTLTHASLSLVDMTGKEAFSYSLGQLGQGNVSRSINVNYLARGLYAVNIETSEHPMKAGTVFVY
jgi:thiol-disulfide isomerase/thioredoxin